MCQDIPMNLVIFADSDTHWYQILSQKQSYNRLIDAPKNRGNLHKTLSSEKHSGCHRHAFCKFQNKTLRVLVRYNVNITLSFFIFSAYIVRSLHKKSIWFQQKIGFSIYENVGKCIVESLTPLSKRQELWRIHRFFVNIPGKRSKSLFSVRMMTQHSDHIKHRGVYRQRIRRNGNGKRPDRREYSNSQGRNLRRPYERSKRSGKGV